MQQQKEKVRMFALARELNMESKDLLALCQHHGLEIKNQLSTVEPEIQEQIRKLVAKPQPKASAPPPAVAPAAPGIPSRPMKNLDARPRPGVAPVPVAPPTAAPAPYVAPVAPPVAPIAVVRPTPVAAPTAVPPPTPAPTPAVAAVPEVKVKVAAPAVAP